MHDSASARQYDYVEEVTAPQVPTPQQNGIAQFLSNRLEYAQVQRAIDEITGASFAMVSDVLSNLQRPLKVDPSRALTNQLVERGVDEKTVKRVIKILTRASNGGLWNALQKFLQTTETEPQA